MKAIAMDATGAHNHVTQRAYPNPYVCGNVYCAESAAQRNVNNVPLFVTNGGRSIISA